MSAPGGVDTTSTSDNQLCFCGSASGRGVLAKASLLVGFASATRGPIFHDGFARLFDGVAQSSGRTADDGVTLAIEDSNLVVVEDDALATFMVEQHDVVGFFLLVIDGDIGTALAEGLNDLRGLRTSSATRRSAEAVARASASTTHFPGLAVGDEDTRVQSDGRVVPPVLT